MTESRKRSNEEKADPLKDVRKVGFGNELRDADETRRLLVATRGLWADRGAKKTEGRFKEANLAASRRIRSRNW